MLKRWTDDKTRERLSRRSNSTGAYSSQ